MAVDTRESQILSLLRRQGALSRRELHRQTGIRPNTVGELVEKLLEARLVRELAPETAGRGRPSVPLEIDPDHRFVAGLSLEPGRVRLATLSLHGEPLAATQDREASGAHAMAQAHDLMASIARPALIAVGVSVTGFVDPDHAMLLVSSAMPESEPVSLQPIFDAAGDADLVLENDLHALAVQWLLAHETEASEDILLIYLRDGAIGAAVLVGGVPNRGCVIGGNELGHTRLPVETHRCFCGQIGCLECVFSTRFLQQHDGPRRTLLEAARAFDPADEPLHEILGYLAMGVANAINLIRPHRVVFASEFVGCEAFTNRLLDAVRQGLLSALASRVRLERWKEGPINFAHAAGSLALASLYRPAGWR